MIPKYIDYFSEQLQISLIKALKRKGNSIKRGKIRIPPQVEAYLIRKLRVTQHLEKTNVLNDLELDQSIGNFQDKSLISNFKIRLGRKSFLKYANSRGLVKTLEEERFLHWEFSRIIKMKDESNEEAVKNWKTKHNSALNQWVKNSNFF